MGIATSATMKKQNGRFPGRSLDHQRIDTQRMFDAAKSQFARFQNASTYFGRALR